MVKSKRFYSVILICLLLVLLMGSCRVGEETQIAATHTPFLTTTRTPAPTGTATLMPTLIPSPTATPLLLEITPIEDIPLLEVDKLLKDGWREPFRREAVMAFSHDGSLLAFDYSGRIIDVLDTMTGDLVYHLVKPSAYHSNVNALAFSPDDTLLAEGGFDETLYIWDVRKDKLVQLLGSGYLFYGNAAIYDIAFSKDGKYLLVASPFDYGGIAVLNSETMQLITKKNISVDDIEISLDGQSIVVGGGTGGTLLIDGLNAPVVIFKDYELSSYQEYFNGIGALSIAISDDQRFIVAATGKDVWGWDDDIKEEIFTMNDFTDRPIKVDISPVGNLAILTSFGEITIWNLENREPIAGMNYPGVLDILFSPDGKSLATIDDKETIILWRIP